MNRSLPARAAGALQHETEHEQINTRRLSRECKIHPTHHSKHVGPAATATDASSITTKQTHTHTTSKHKLNLSPSVEAEDGEEPFVQASMETMQG